MLNQVTSLDVMTKDYPISHTFAWGARTEEPDMSAILDGVLFLFEAKTLPMRHSLYESLLRLFEIDLSSVHPHFEPMTATSVVDEFYEETPFEEELEYDVVLRMPPVRQRSMRVRVRSVRKATPRIVEPEGFWPWG
jgi:hypothetical protein